ncbi:family 2B encapsulin nanocompartment shell protein [Kutzneria albida]|uniref:family 2B encapsulin nanocompartment shell protein n=2 Tax=Kutzneria TaxID=43356 RepID=UPI00046C8B6F|nr:family 2B encapsulin nanocompartment shell protein [Kutzneria albida]
MVVTETLEPGVGTESQSQLSLGTAAARNLSTTTKSVPQMQGITSRWLLRVLPWVQVNGGVYRVNRRLSYTVGDGRIEFVATGAEVRVIPAELGELSILRGFEDMAVLTALAGRFTQREFSAGETIVAAGQAADQVVLIAHGKVSKVGAGKYGDETVLGTLADGDYFGDRNLVETEGAWEFTAKAATSTTVLTLSRAAFQEVSTSSEALREQLVMFQANAALGTDEHGEASIEMSAGHTGEPDLPGTFVDYDSAPREYELSVAQTVLRVHSRVADLYNEPMNQTEQQLRLTIEALRERQEHEMVNSRDFGLLHNADFSQRIPTRSGPPTPDDMDELLSKVWKDPSVFLAHPKTIVAFATACTRAGIYPDTAEFNGHQVPAWRGIPLLPCNKIPVTEQATSSIILMRTGQEGQGVIGLQPTAIPDEYKPGLSVRFMGISEKAIISYLVSAYFSAAVLVPDALAILEDVELGRTD